MGLFAAPASYLQGGSMKQIPKKYTAYMLQTCNRDMTSYEGFKWKKRGYVEAPDWNDKAECGSGLHGLLWGCGDADSCDLNPSAVWLVCKIDMRTVVDLIHNIKVPYCSVVFAGDRDSAVSKIISLGAQDKSVVFARKIGGHYSTLNGGCHSVLSGGCHSVLSGGDYSVLNGGDDSVLIGKEHSVLSGGYGSTLSVEYCDGRRYRIAIGYVGEGLKAGVAYKLGNNGKFIEAKGEE